MTIYDVHEAETHFSKLLEQVLRGEEVVIAMAGKPVGRLLPFAEDDFSPRVPGMYKGKVMIMFDFDTPLSEFG